VRAKISVNLDQAKGRGYNCGGSWYPEPRNSWTALLLFKRDLIFRRAKVAKRGMMAL
jgi:hypothetical protein